MYLNYFGFAREPFHITPDPEFLFLSTSHKEALGSILYGIEKKKGFITITGAVGTGKTTVLRACIERLDREHTRLIYIFNPALDFPDLVMTVLAEIGCEASAQEESGLVQELLATLIREYEKEKNVVLIIDEAQNMPVETMERMRMLSNLETPKDKLLQIVMVGQPELEEILGRIELRQLAQRIAMKSTIRPLTPEESRNYIAHRMERAGAGKRPIFTKGAVDEIVHEAKGIPRVINVLCDNALVSAYGYQKNPVSRSLVREIVSDYRGRPHGSGRLYPRLVGSLVVSAFIGGLIYFFPAGYGPKSQESQKTSVSPPLEEIAVAREKGNVQGEENSEMKSESVKANEGARQRPIPQERKYSRYRRMVKKGDSLSLLALEMYGRTDRNTLDALKRRNPSLVNGDRIEADGEIILPDLDWRPSRRKQRLPRE